jgi:DNA-binding SARP family transcriptional activator
MSHAPLDTSTWDGEDAVILPLRPAAPDTCSARFAIDLLGSFELQDRTTLVTLPAAAQRLVALLAIERRPLTRAHVAGFLWPDKTDTRATANLRSTLWRLNNCVDSLVECDGGHLAITEDVAVDIDLLVLDHQPAADAPLLSTTTAAMLAHPPTNAELLADWDDDWVAVERERIRQQTLRALENAALELRELGFYSEAIEAGTTAVRLAPLRESAHRSVIEVHLAEGNYAEAVRQYDAFRALLFDAFGVEPSPNLTELFQHLTVDKQGRR